MPPDAWGSAEICSEYGISRQAFAKWRAQPDFPAGLELAAGTVYDPDEIRSWVATHRPERAAIGGGHHA